MDPLMDDKDRVYFSVCSAILKMEVEKGHLKWGLTDISRESKITRSLIYYYFGKEKELILKEAYRFILEIFFTPALKYRTRSIPERMKRTLEHMDLMPYLFVLYFLQKKADSDIGKMLRKAEEDLFVYMKKLLPELSEQEILELYLKELGAIAFHLPMDQVERLFGQYLKHTAH